MRNKRLFKILICMLVVISLSTSVMAWDKEEKKECEEKENSIFFKDVQQNHWAYQAILWMAKEKIISGYTDGTFKPNNAVTRAEFAKMMVLALKLNTVKPKQSSFIDINRDNWAFPYIEAAKVYLTGFRSASGDYFLPGTAAVREDMAVGLVKALGLANTEAAESILQKFGDETKISPNLKKYVAIAVKNEIMKGYPVQGKDTLDFGPQNTLTRAEAAALLHRSIIGTVEKVTYDENEKVTYDVPQKAEEKEEAAFAAPEIESASYQEGKLVLEWKEINDERLQGYKVVISKNNANPKYPENGYLYWIADRKTTTAVIDNNEPYKNGDFGKYLVSGEKYYFSITAVYGDRKVPGKAILVEYP